MKRVISMGMMGLVVVLGGFCAAAAAAEVLCASPSGAVTVRTQCKSNET